MCLVQDRAALEGGEVSPDHGEVRHITGAAVDDVVQPGGFLVQGCVCFHSEFLLCLVSPEGVFLFALTV